MEKLSETSYMYKPAGVHPKGSNNGRSGSSARGAQGPSACVHDEEKSNCFCFESDDDSTEKIRLKYTKRKLARGCLSNMTICVVLVGYTFLGAVVFLAIEGGSVFYALSQQKSVGPTLASVSARPSNATLHVAEESRLKTVENIWEITVSLNILYKENWTRLAAQEITRFQESIVKHLAEEMSYQSVTSDELRGGQGKTDWTLAKAFLYSLTVLTTIGYGNMAPRTGLGKAVTMGYAALGIPLVLLYLSSVGSLLSSCARNVFTRSLCCCLCSNCGYCCYDEKRMQEKERRMKKKREKRELERRLRAAEPFYVRSASDYTTSTGDDPSSPRPEEATKEPDRLSTDASAVDSKTGDFLAPLLLCLVVMIVYVGGGALVLCGLESSWSFLDAVFFCFMLLSTIGFGDSAPPDSVLSGRRTPSGELALWFCSSYILCGLALTAMCFSVVHEEIVHRLRHRYAVVEEPADSKENSVGSFKVGDSASYTRETPDDYLAGS